MKLSLDYSHWNFSSSNEDKCINNRDTECLNVCSNKVSKIWGEAWMNAFYLCKCVVLELRIKYLLITIFTPCHRSVLKLNLRSNEFELNVSPMAPMGPIGSTWKQLSQRWRESQLHTTCRYMRIIGLLNSACWMTPCRSSKLNLKAAIKASNWSNPLSIIKLVAS